MKFKEYDEKTFLVKKLKSGKKPYYVKTSIPMSNRTFKNIPKYSTGKNKVDWKEWLGIKGEKTHASHSSNSIGKAESDGAWWGWSHRACYGFKVGDKVKADTVGNKSGKEFVIKTEDQAKEMAISFAKGVS